MSAGGDRADRLDRWAARARAWAEEAERRPEYSRSTRLQVMAAAKRRAAETWGREAAEIRGRA